MKMRIFSIAVLWLVTVAVMVAIFDFSEQKAPVSQKTGESFTYKTFSVSRNFRKLPEQNKQKIVKDSQPFIRKAAHFSIYALLGVSMLASFSVTFGKTKFICLVSWLACIIYACTDELHQTFVSGRAGRLTDIMIDSFGAATGMCFLMLLVLLVKTVMKKRRKKRSLS